MFVRDVFRGSSVWVFDPARRPGTPVWQRTLTVSHAAGTAVRDELFSTAPAPARRLYRVGEPVDPWIHVPGELAAYLGPRSVRRRRFRTSTRPRRVVCNRSGMPRR